MFHLKLITKKHQFMQPLKKAGALQILAKGQDWYLAPIRRF